MVNRIFFGRDNAISNSSVVIGTPTQTAWADVSFCNSLPPLLAGDILAFTAEREFECPVAYNTELVTAILLSNGPVSCKLDSIGSTYFPGTIIGTDTNISTNHYWNVTRACEFQLPADLPTPWSQFRVRCRSTAATGDDSVVIKPGQGHFTISVWR